MIGDVLELLCGEDVYFDTAYVLRSTPKERFEEMIRKHGEDKILFASDSPWGDMAADVERIKKYGLGKETEYKIFYENGKKLLGI